MAIKELQKIALLANVPDIPYDQLEKVEMIRIDPYKNDIPFNWERKDS